jgi:hypothetical protein
MAERLALVLATVLAIAVLFLPPSWEHPFADVCHLAGLLALVTIAVFWATRALGPRGRRAERYIAALFLAAMPLVYITAWYQTGGAGAANYWLPIEIAGFPAYGGLALVGLTHPWLLAVGIAAHGITWDLWHHFTATGYVPHWYATGCLVVDLALGLYLFIRLRA